MNKGRLVKAFIGKYLSLRGREVKTTVLISILGGVEDRSSSTEFGKNLILIDARSTQN